MSVIIIPGPATGGGGGSLFSGQQDIDFGNAPGLDSVTVAIARPTVTAAAAVTAVLYPQATANKSMDEHLMERISVWAHDVVPGVGFSVTASSTGPGLLTGIFSTLWESTE